MGGKSLVNTFPFNSRNQADHGHGPHGHHEDHNNRRQPSLGLDARSQRQGSDGGAPSFADVAGAGPGADGKRWIEMVEETEYDDVVQCDHSYDKRCHTTYVTNYESQ